MGKIYYERITSHKMIFDDVPELFKAPTKQYFKDKVRDCTITKAQYKEFIGETFKAS